MRKLVSSWQNPATFRVSYEAGPTGYELKRQLEDLGVSCQVVAPALVPRRAGVRVKTDRRDALNLAGLYRAGELTPIRVPSPEEEAIRDLVCLREDLKQDVLRARHRLSKFLLRHGRHYEGRSWTRAHTIWLNAQEFSHPAEKSTFSHYMIDSTPLPVVVDQGAAGTTQLVVETDTGSEAQKALQDPFFEAFEMRSTSGLWSMPWSDSLLIDESLFLE